MEITLSEKELIYHLNNFLKSLTIRKLLIEALEQYENSEENIDTENSDGEEVLRMKIGKIHLKKRGRPRKNKIEKNFQVEILKILLLKMIHLMLNIKNDLNKMV
jgi:hypothetical protein